MNIPNFESHPERSEIMTGVKDLMRKVAENFEDASEVLVESMPWQPSDGFIPFTKGGVQGHFLLPVNESAVYNFERLGGRKDVIERLRKLSEDTWLDCVYDFAMENNINPEMLDNLNEAMCADRQKAFEIASNLASELDEDQLDSYIYDRLGFVKVSLEILYNPEWAKEECGADTLMRMEVNFDYPYFRETGNYRSNLGSTGYQNPIETLSEINLDMPDRTDVLLEEAQALAQTAFRNADNLRKTEMPLQII